MRASGRRFCGEGAAGFDVGLGGVDVGALVDGDRDAGGFKQGRCAGDVAGGDDAGIGDEQDVVRPECGDAPGQLGEPSRAEEESGAGAGVEGGHGED